MVNIHTKKIGLITLSAMLVAVSCQKEQTASKNPTGFEIKNVLEQSKLTKDSIYKEGMVPPTKPPTKLNNSTSIDDKVKKRSLIYRNNELPKPPSSDRKGLEALGFIHNQIEVVMEPGTNLKISKDNSNRLAFSEESQKSLMLQKTLSSLGVLTGFDLTGDMSLEEIDADYKRIQKAYTGSIPSRYDFQTYVFKEDVNLLEALKAIREIPFVKAANLVQDPEISSFTKQQLSRIKVNATPVTKGTTPSDNSFQTEPETKWWHFNRHQILKGWDVYGTTDMPTIAVIDSGFDNHSSAIDRPNYLSGRAITLCTAIGESNCVVTFNPVEPTHVDDSFSHGTIVSSVLGAPRNSDNYAGVAPNAPIYPIRVADSGYTEVNIRRNNLITAIRHAAANSSIDVISMSISSGGNMCPSSMNDASTNYEIASAISAGKIVVAAAGNALNDLQNSRNPAVCGGITAGEIVVGGVKDDTTVTPNRTAGWYAGYSYTY